MILKKPYAFIMKHFRIIHFLLLIPMIYLIIRSREIAVFFREYVANGYMISASNVLSNLASDYINVWMYLSVIVILLITIFLSAVLQRKGKPAKYYNICIIYYIFIFIALTVGFNIFSMIETDTLDDVLARIIRDLVFIIEYSQYIFVVFTIIRGIGFNLKRFNFKDELSDVEIGEEDAEEFEFSVGLDTDKLKRSGRRFLRELKYYYKENKFIVTVILVIVALAAGTAIYQNRAVAEKTYKENENLSFGYLTINVKDTYISNLSLSGDVLKEDKTYVVALLELTNRYREEKEFNYANVNLVINKMYVKPNLTLGSYFSDFGNPYSGGLIGGDSTNNIILVYEIDKDLANANMTIEAFSQTGSGRKKIKIKPNIIVSNVGVNTVSTGTEITLDKTNLKNTKIAITGYELTTRQEYNYEYCLNSGNCYTGSDAVSLATSEFGRFTLLVLDYNLSLDKESSYMYSNKDYKNFFNDFLKIKYQINGKEKSLTSTIVNPNNYNEKLILKVPKEIETADEIVAGITVRNVSYQVKLK